MLNCDRGLRGMLGRNTGMLRCDRGLISPLSLSLSLSLCYNVLGFRDIRMFSSTNFANYNNNRVNSSDLKLRYLKDFLDDFNIESQDIIIIENSLKLILRYIEIANMGKSSRKQILNKFRAVFFKLGLKKEQMDIIFNDFKGSLDLDNLNIKGKDKHMPLPLPSDFDFILNILDICKNKGVIIDMEDKLVIRLINILNVFSKIDNVEVNNFIKLEKDKVFKLIID